MSDLLPLDKPRALAKAFVRVLADWLTPLQMREVRRRNQMYLLAGETMICASHDFCDANMAMHEAFIELGIPTPGDDESPVEDQRVQDLWNCAWNIAFTWDLQP